MDQVAVLKPGASTEGATAGTDRVEPSDAEIPIAVDLDGTLIQTDSLTESVFVLVKHRPGSLLSVPLWFVRGRAGLKRQLAANSLPEAATIPFNDALLAYLREQKQRGRRLVLATGADERVARALVDPLELFEDIFASDGSTNLTGERKRERLVAAFGERGYDYAGNDARDLPVWRSARRAILVSPSPRLADAVRGVTELGPIFAAPRPTLELWLTELRWHHWLKNLLVFVPLAAAHRLHEAWPLWQASLAFIGFCLAASSIYLVNDLIDLPVDRRHARKRERPLAAGRISVTHAIAMVPVLWLLATAIAMGLSASYFVVLAVYEVLMLAYGLRFKDLRFVDALLLGLGYTLRIVAGAVAVGVAVPAWLLLCSVPMFFGLALLKRLAELTTANTHGIVDGRARAYGPGDKRRLAAVGAGAGFVAVAALAAYPLVEPAAQAGRGAVWVMSALVALWLLRMWRLAARGAIRDDPVLFALRDPASVAAGAAVLVLLVFAS